MREIKIGDQTFEIHYGQNAICALEDELDASVLDIVVRLDRGQAKLRDMRAVIWAGMLAKRRTITPNGVGEILDKAGVRIRDIADECLVEFYLSFAKYIVADSKAEQSEEPEKND